MAAYYNEFDPYAAQWLRNLIAAGHIAGGDVDERSIKDVRADDLRGYTQCHFFAGVGIWSLALRRAGWSDDRSVWTGSCPCQPFSSSGRGEGFQDERHLWPYFFELIREHGPEVVFGEQVASKDAEPWIDLVHADMERVDYRFAAIPFPSAGIGAPHIRDRLYWVADASSAGIRAERFGAVGTATSGAEGKEREQRVWIDAGEGCTTVVGMAHAEQHDCGRQAKPTNHIGPQTNRPANQHGRHSGSPVWLADTNDNQQRKRRGAGSESTTGDESGLEPSGRGIADSLELRSRPGPVNGFWAGADWIFCRDGKWRPVEPGTQPLVDGHPNRVGRLRAYGNAINAEAARVFIEAYCEVN